MHQPHARTVSQSLFRRALAGIALAFALALTIATPPTRAAVPIAPGSGGARVCSGQTPSHADDGMTPVDESALHVTAGDTVQAVAMIRGARELVAMPNGDLIVGTKSNNVYIVPDAEARGAVGAPHIFASIQNESIPPGEPSGGDNPEGVAFSQSTCTLYVSTEFHVYATPYRDGDLKAENLHPIATVRTGPIADPGDGDNHTSTSLAVAGATLFASMGSSCNGCTGEHDPQRAAIWEMNLDGSHARLYAEHIRNAIALAVDPLDGHLWAGDAGQDSLPLYHPYEFVDDVSLHADRGVANYGWPYCEENRIHYNRGNGSPADCSNAVEPLVEFPAYLTHVGAAFYPVHPTGRYAIHGSIDGALIVTSHGSWHLVNGCRFTPEVDFIPMRDGRPVTPMTQWGTNLPHAQFSSLVSGFQPSCDTRIGRPTGVTVGPQDSIFIADDSTGAIYRIRP